MINLFFIILVYLLPSVNDALVQHVPEAIRERERKKAEKKQKKVELLALTAYSIENSVLPVGDAASGADKGTDRLLAIEADRPPEPPLDDEYTVAHPYAAALDV